MVIPQFTIPDRMRKAREVAGLEQSDMAERLGVTRTTVSRWETGASPVKPMVLRAWAEETNVPSHWLRWGITEAPAPEPITSGGGGELPRLDSNQQPFGYRSVTSLAEKRARAAARRVTSLKDAA